MIRRDDFDSDLQQRLEELANEKGVRPEEIVRSALEEYLSLHPSAGKSEPQAAEFLFDRWSKLGVIGAIQGEPDSPRDLSTNPRHFEGFGK